MEEKSVLIVEDSPTIRGELSEMLSIVGFRPHAVERKREFLTCLDRQAPDLLLFGSGIHEGEIEAFAEVVKREKKDIPVLFIRNGQESLEGVKLPDTITVSCLGSNFEPPELKKALENLVIRIETPEYKALDSSIIGKTPAMMQMKRHILRLAKSDLTVLITGESGTGKELVARALHRFSPRANKPFIKVNSPSVPTHLFESELFGFEKGAFTGALKKKPGKFQLAHTGSFFLDEIGEFPLPMQAKLLQVLDDYEVSPLGSTTNTKIDTRVLAATNAGLNRMLSPKHFRQDLYYRLSVTSIYVPPLRERKNDIDLLCDYFLRKYSAHYGKELEPLSDQVRRQFKQRDWPGNIRELENAILYIVAMGKAEIVTTRQLKRLKAYPLKEAGKKAAQKAEKNTLEQVLSYTNWNRKRAAALLETSYRTLLNKIKEYGIRQKVSDF
ncbi:MAG: hypothetical protein BBJ60_02210 [Desulfobacterales bacterium S7086C20]|nr:MAG: hypothetical protein BBJ60_02210 [Desulfobacterales bacterium S7086C20]